MSVIEMFKSHFCSELTLSVSSLKSMNGLMVVLVQLHLFTTRRFGCFSLQFIWMVSYKNTELSENDQSCCGGVF